MSTVAHPSAESDRAAATRVAAALLTETGLATAGVSTGSSFSPCSKWGSHSSHFGRYQFQSPSSFIDAGRRIARTIVASIRIADASPTPNCLNSIA